MFWQILEDKNTITFTMFEAGIGVDDGDIYMRKDLTLTGYEKSKPIIQYLCAQNFMKNLKQNGEETFYSKRTSELNTNKFNLLRIVDNYPAFFYKDKKKYVLKIDNFDLNKNGTYIIAELTYNMRQIQLKLRKK